HQRPSPLPSTFLLLPRPPPPSPLFPYTTLFRSINPRNLAAHPPGRDAPTAKPSSLPRCALVAPLTSPAETRIQHAIENVKHGCFAFHRVKLAWGLAPHGLSFLIEDLHLYGVQLQYHPTVHFLVPLDA